MPLTRSPARRAVLPISAALTAGALLAAPGAALAQEPPECLSPNPSDWPAPSKPYFLLLVDTSGSMVSCTTPPSVYPDECNQAAAGYKLNSCGFVPNRINDAKCALRQTVQAFGGESNFGLATFASYLTSCPAGACVSDCGVPNGGTCGSDFYGCTWNTFPNTSGTTAACGNFPNCASTGPALPNLAKGSWRDGANILVGIEPDSNFVNNTGEILKYFDGQCGDAKELFAAGSTPIAGSLRGATEYLRAGWTRWSQTNYCSAGLSYTFPTPLRATDRACRSVNVLLVTDGDESCDTQADAVAAAQDLYQNGVTLGSTTWKVHTYVINFAGGSKTNTDQIAAAGGTTSSYSVQNETQLSQALANIIGGAVKPETCDNVDNNCNGCTDEGFKHYCDVGQTCCAWTTAAQRTTCLTTYLGTITQANPGGDTTKLPCTTSAQAATPSQWLCYNPGDVCDNTDNNCDGQIDENQLKCGNPLHCPQTEVCDGQDNNCNGVVDEGCPSVCKSSPEVCDGCDNDCNGLTDDGAAQASIPCGPNNQNPAIEAANCIGTITCKAPQAVAPGTCVANGGFTACSIVPQTETCDGKDNDCDGIVDNDVPAIPCIPTGAPAGLNYGPNSQCKMGHTTCTNGVTACVGWVGPSAEVCDGIDNNCNGSVDDGVLPGTGASCGINQLPCKPGTTACVNGALVCTGGVQPQPEICDGIDNNCNGEIDEAPLVDAPAPGANGCWNDPGNCCSFPSPAVPGGPPVITWCPPAGATCNGLGTLTQPCATGVLQCSGTQGWICKGPKGPSAEVCDGVDNDCNGQVDDGSLPGTGQSCGSATPPCMLGVKACVNGALTCAGGVLPQPEVCDGIDNDCNGVIDDGIPIGAPCTPTYDTNAYPGVRTFPPCQQGHLECDGMGAVTCVGGVVPQPEVCDGVDNDCDGQIDELGAPPDGINGTANPFPPPAANIGDACGVSQGTCAAGTYGCVGGQFACVGSQAKADEVCDCKDNDCDGQIDNPNPPGHPPLCGSGKDCVKAAFGCLCAAPCDITKEFPCPGGQVCQDVVSSNTGQSLGKYCISDPCGGDCTGQTVKDTAGKILCAPPGSPADPATCATPPVCACKGQAGCKDPCYGVVCDPGSVCSSFGAKAGQCVADSCFANPCKGCDQVCNLGACAPNPCATMQCQSDEECRPDPDFMSAKCVKACGSTTCPSGQACKDGVCAPTCMPACASGQVCDLTQNPPACVMDRCQPNPCTDGSFCDPVTGQCGNDPCAGVVCPTGETCRSGDCFTGGTGGGSSSSSSSGSTSSSSSGSTTGAGASGTGGSDNRVWGLATGGGGCSCETGPGAGATSRWALALVAAALGAARARRKRRQRGAGEEVAS